MRESLCNPYSHIFQQKLDIHAEHMPNGVNRGPRRSCQQGAHSKALAMLVLIGDVDQKGHDAGVVGHEPHYKVDAEVDAFHDQALLARLASRHQPLHTLDHHL